MVWIKQLKGVGVLTRMDLYLRFSRMAHEIYAEYTDRQEPYGIDECWLDVTGSSSLKGDGLLIAQEISRRMKSELGLTVSVGVSFNKIFAKLGSDYKKPDAITTMYKSEFKQKAWSLPVADESDRWIRSCRSVRRPELLPSATMWR